MAKLANWQAALSQYLTENSATPFSYDPAVGLDCCRFTFQCIHIQTGKPFAARFMDGYKTEKQALEMMRACCGRASLGLSVSVLMAEYGFEPVIWSFARRGDPVLFPNGKGRALGILDLGGKDIIAIAEQGLIRVPISPKCRAWHII